MAIVTGTSSGGKTSEDREFHSLYAEGSTRVHPLTIARTMGNAGASRIAREYGIVGPCLHRFHRMRFGQPRDRPSVLDGASRHGRRGHRGWIGSALLIGIPEGLGSHAHRRAGYLPSIFARS